MKPKKITPQLPPTEQMPSREKADLELYSYLNLKGAYYTHPRLSSEEQELFAVINTVYSSAYQEVYDHIDPLLTELKFGRDDKDFQIKVAGLGYVNRAVRIAGKFYFSELLDKAAEEAVQAGRLTAEESAILKRETTIRPFDIKKVKIQNNILSCSDPDYSSIIESPLLVDSIKATEEWIAKFAVTERARSLALQVLDESKETLERYDHAVNTIGSKVAHKNFRPEITAQCSAEDLLLTFAASGKYYHTTAAFRDQADKQVFSALFAKSVGKLYINASSEMMSEEAINRSVGKMADRISSYDAKLTKNQDAIAVARQQYLDQMAARRKPAGHEEAARLHAENAQRRQEEIAERQRAELLNWAEKKSRENEAFMASPQAYKLGDDADRTMHVINTLANGSGAKSLHAQMIQRGVYEAAALIDMRDESQKELGKLLLSPHSLHCAAKASGMEDSVKTIPFKPMGTLNDRSQQLRMLYHTSDEVKKLVDTMLADENMALLIAIHTRGEERAAIYAANLSDATKKLSRMDEPAVIRNRLGDPTDDDLRVLLADSDLEKEPDIIKLKAVMKQQEVITAARQSLAAEITQVFDGVPPRKIARAGAANTTIEKTTAEARVPEAWFSILGEDCHLGDSPKGPKHVEVHSNKYPDISATVKITATPDELRKATSQLAIAHGDRETNRKMIKNLRQNHGFSLSIDNGKQVICHTQYGISLPLQGSEQDKTRILSQAMERFDLKRFEQESILTTLSNMGITAKQSNTDTGKATTLKLPGDSYVTLAPSGYFTDDDFAIAQGLISQSLPAASNGNGRQETMAAQNTGKRIWKPGKHDDVMIFDANVLNNLSVSRTGNHGKSWVHIVQETARMGVPVLVPEAVVFELTGLIPTKAQTGWPRHYKLVDESFKDATTDKSASASNLRHLFVHASHGQIEANGEMTVTGPGNNIIVVSTPEDIELYHKIQHMVLSAAKQERGSRLAKYIYDNGEGEKAISRIVKALPAASFAVVTDDRNYVKNSGHAVTSTTSGRPVVYAGTGAYLDSEINASRERYLELTRKLHSPTALSIHAVGKDIVNAGRGIGPEGASIMQYYTRTTDPQTGKEYSIHTFIRKALDRRLHGPAESGAAAKNWAHNALRQSGAENIALRTERNGGRSPA